VHEEGEGWAGNDVNEKTDPNTAHVRAFDAVNPAELGFRDAIGGGVGYADRYFNHAGELWAVCAVHQVRWYVTRELSLVDRSERLGHPDPGAASKLPEVDGVFRVKRLTAQVQQLHPRTATQLSHLADTGPTRPSPLSG